MSLPDKRPTGSGPRFAPSFTVHVDLVGGRIRLAGQLGHETAHLFQEAISTLLRADHDTWVIDTSGLTGCDQIGVRAIGAAYRRALRHNRRMTLAGAPPPLQRSLRRLRLDHHILDGPSSPGTVPHALPRVVPEPLRPDGQPLPPAGLPALHSSPCRSYYDSHAHPDRQT
jgi:anti-anti-sigma regulatory factor